MVRRYDQSVHDELGERSKREEPHTIKKQPVLGRQHCLERGSSVVECRTRNRVSPGSNPPLIPFGRLGIFLLSIDAPVDSAV